MLRLTAKNLWAHKLRLALTGLSVVLGVAFMTGTMVLTDTMEQTFDSLLEINNEGIDVVVQQPLDVDPEWGDARERVPAAIVERVRSVDGVDAASGVIAGFAQLVEEDGSVASLDGLGATVGINWVTDDELNPFDLATGRAPEVTGEAVLDRATVEEQGWELGDRFTVLARGEPVSLTLVGTATYGEIDGIPGSSVVGLGDEQAQALFAQPGYYDSVAVAAAPGADVPALVDVVDEALGAGTYEVLTGEADTAQEQDSLHQDLAFFSQFLLAFAFIALFVGTFIIYNTFSILVAQRTRDMAMLRAIGAGRRQVLGSVLAESVVVGIVAGAVGLALGVVMAHGLRALLGAVGLEIPDGPAVVSTTTMVTAFVVGTGVTVLSAVAPAVRAGRVRPIAALRDGAVDRSAVSRRRTVVGGLLAATGIGAFASGVVGEGSAALQLLGLGAVVTFVGVFVLGPVIARPVVALAGAPVQRLTGVTGRLARENATRSPKRTAATASALMVGVSLVGFITILASSTKASVSDNVDRTFRAEYVIDSGAWQEGGFSPDLASRVAALDVVEAVSPLRTTSIVTGDGTVTAQAVDTATIDDLVDMEPQAGRISDVGPGEVALRDTEAEELGASVGDTVTVSFARTGPLRLEVAAVFGGSIAGADDASYLLDLSTYEANVTDQYDQRIFVSTDDSVDATTTFAALEAALAAQPNAEVQDQAAFKQSVTSEIDAILNLIYGLLGLAVVIALIGIANTLALSVHERRREIGLLRAVGMTRRQVRSTVRQESVLIALMGTALGTLLAVAGSWGIVQALADQSVTTFSVPPVQLAVIVAIAALAGVVAAVGPARRAADLDVLTAIGSA